MIIDLIFLMLIIFAVWKGYHKGLIVAVFSLLAFIIGLAAAVKFSAMVAGWLGNQISVTKQWLPLISFALVFFLVTILVKIGAKFMEKSVQFVLLGWVNKLGGILFFLLLYLLIFSVLLFYAVQLKLVTTETITASKSYEFIQPFGPKVIDGFGMVLPFFKDLFIQLQQFFDTIQSAK